MSQLFVDTITEKTAGNGVQIPGHVVQVQRTEWSADNSTSSTSFVDTGRYVTITPTSATSKILVTVITGYWTLGSGNVSDYLASTIYRNGTTNLGQPNDSDYGVFLNRAGYTDSNYTQMAIGQIYDSPATTSATTYNYYVRATAGNTIYYGDQRIWSSITAMEIAQ
jgi:hypothetical protein